MNKFIKGLIITFIAAVTLASCSGLQTFNQYARSGDTVAIASGWQTDFGKENITVTITPSIGAQIIIPPNDPSIRATVNLYPDPVSNMVVSRESDISTSFTAKLIAGWITDNTNGDKDWYQSTVFLDLPTTLPEGLTQVDISNGVSTASSTLQIINGVGAPHDFAASIIEQGLTPAQLEALARAQNYEISFTGATIPYAIEVSLLHDPDVDNGGTGRAVALNPTGYKKNLAWNDDGISTKVILTPSSGKAFDNMKDYKFYIAGGVTNVIISNTQAYDVNGNIVSGVVAGIAQFN